MSDVQITVRYFAAARSAAGIDQEPVPVPAGTTVAGLLELLAGRHRDLEPVLARSSYLLDEIAVLDDTRTLAPGMVFDILPPFAGG